MSPEITFSTTLILHTQKHTHTHNHYSSKQQNKPKKPKGVRENQKTNLIIKSLVNGCKNIESSTRKTSTSGVISNRRRNCINSCCWYSPFCHFSPFFSSSSSVLPPHLYNSYVGILFLF